LRHKPELSGDCIIKNGNCGAFFTHAQGIANKG
jgi:hypothetical protein